MASSSTVGMAAAALVLVAVAALAHYSPNPTPAEQARRDHERVMAELDTKIAVLKQASKPKLRIESWRCYKEHGYYFVAGTVSNISSSSLDSVTAVATFETEDGQFVKNDQAMIDYQPVMAGQTSPFTVITTGNPAIARCRLAFKHLFGAAIPYNE